MSKIRGKLRQRPSGYWEVDMPHKGKRYRLGYYLGVMPCPNQTAADEFRLILNAEIRRDPHSWNPNRHKRRANPLWLETYSKTWLETLDVSDATMHDYQNSLKNHILPKLGREYLPDITTDKLKIFQKNIQRQPKGKKNVMDCLKMIMRAAMISGYITHLPGWPKLKVKKPKIRYIEIKDQFKILLNIPAEHRYIFTFIVLTGCRMSEARAFRKIDIKSNHIVFAKTFGRGERLKDVKGFSEAPFPLYDALRGLLQDVPRNLTPFVFIHPKTGNHYGKNFNRIWNKACDRAGVRRIPLRINRHSFGCNVMNSGIDKSIVQRLLRHTDSKMTDRYAEYNVESLSLALDNVYSLKGDKWTLQKNTKIRNGYCMNMLYCKNL